MASKLDARGCVELARCIVDGFSRGDFVMFDGEFLGGGFTSQVSAEQSFVEQAYAFVTARNTKGYSGDLLDRLRDYWSKEAQRNDLIDSIEPLIAQLNKETADPSWFFSYAHDMDDDWVEKLENNHTFDDAFGGMLQRPSSSGIGGKISEGLRNEINQSEYFVALLSQYYVRSVRCPEIFSAAFESWRTRLSDEKSRQKLIVLVLDDAGEKWWTENYLSTAPPDGCSYWTKFRVRDDFAALKKSLTDWVKTPPSDSGFPQTSSVIVLGEPTGGSPENVSTNVEELVSDLGKLTVERDGFRVDFWQDDWSKRKMSESERAQTFARSPIFVRTIADRSSTVREAQAALKPHLLNAFGFEFSDEASWLAEFGRFRRIYWRPDGPDWPSEGVDLGWTGQVQGLAARLAELAGFPGASRKVIVRYEDPKSVDPAQTQLNRQRVIESLESAAQAGAGRGMVSNTVPISFEKIEDSIRRFTKTGLNVIALHDLEAQRDDTIRRFEGADKLIDSVVSKSFGNAQRPPILRVAVLLRNASSFEGLKFDHDSTVHRWNLLKRTATGDGTLKFDEQGLRNIVREARDLLADMS